MTIWFTGDTHFGHRGILRHQADTRPWSSVEEMDNAMIDIWNKHVAKNDLVYHIGDFAMKKPDEYLARLNGQIYQIYGNHDQAIKKKHKFTWQGHYKEIKIGEQNIVLFHYACRVWNKCHYGSWQLHGHSHGSLPDINTMKQFDIGWDVWGRPISFDEVAKQMEKYEFVPVDHHKDYRAKDE